MLLIGLTGNYGMGKSTVLSMFKKCGAYILSADEIVRELLEKSHVNKKIKTGKTPSSRKIVTKNKI